MRLKDFAHNLEFSSNWIGAVYVIFCVVGDVEIPFYVGQTDSPFSRIGDYHRANMSASTDFKVGEAIKYLRDKKGHRIVVGYRESMDRLREEDKIIADLRSRGNRLLNDLIGSKYASADKDGKISSIQKFCDDLVAHLANP